MRIARGMAGSRLDLVRFPSPAKCRADEDDDETAEAAHRDVRSGPPKGDELEQVRKTSHRRHEHVGEREEEAKEPSERAGSRGERGEERDGRHRERRPEGVISGRERDHRQDQAQTSRDQRQTPRDARRPAGAGGRTMMPARAARSVALKWGKAALSASPAKRPQTM
jgi:hypothetical protein